MEIFLSCLLALSICLSLWLYSRLRRRRSPFLTSGTSKYRSVKRSTALSDSTLHALLNALEDAVLVVNDRMEVIYTNEALVRMFQVRHNPVGRNLIEVLLDHRIVRIIRRSLTSGEPSSEEIEFVSTHDGSTKRRVIAVNALPVTDNGSSFTRVIMRDESNRHETEQLRRDFVANASHELRTPLSIIHGYIENLLDGAVADQALAERFLKIMEKHSKRISQIIEDMLTISKLESSSGLPERTGYFNLGACVRDVIERLSPLIEEKKAILHLEFCEDETLLVGDRFYWDQIFFNLIENALKQNPQRGLNVRVIVESQESHYRIQVIDDGVGIPSKDLPFIFKRFYRVEKHHSKEIQGTGLGLSIVKRAVEAHGGTVTARSKPGVETAFLIDVPKSQMQPMLDADQEAATKMESIGAV